MTTPSEVSALRSRLAKIAGRAMRNVSRRLEVQPSLPVPTRQLAVRSAVHDDPPVPHADGAPGVCGDLRLVRHQHHRQFHELATGRRVEGAGRLVGEQDARVHDERSRDRDALLLTAGEFVRQVHDAIAQADAHERLGNAPLAVGSTLVDQRQLNLLEGRHARLQVVGLEAEGVAAQARAGVLGELFDVTPGEELLARAGRVEQVDDVHQRALAGSRLAHDGDELPRSMSRLTPASACTSAPPVA